MSEHKLKNDDFHDLIMVSLIKRLKLKDIGVTVLDKRGCQYAIELHKDGVIRAGAVNLKEFDQAITFLANKITNGFKQRVTGTGTK
jgi:hypothetical protein